MLEFDGEWRYDSPGAIEPEIEFAFRQLINRICAQGQRQAILEYFKSHFAAAAGVPHHWSSDVDWASTDLERIMSEAAANAPLFIEAFHDACEVLKKRCPDIVMPGLERTNRILSDAGSGYCLELPKLVRSSVRAPIPIPDQLPSLDARARAAIEDALRASERALSEGNGRQAVQEALWLLETVSTAFRRPEVLDGGISGRYFNRIIGELRHRAQGHPKQILQWMMKTCTAIYRRLRAAGFVTASISMKVWNSEYTRHVSTVVSSVAI